MNDYEAKQTFQQIVAQIAKRLIEEQDDEENVPEKPEKDQT